MSDENENRAKYALPPVDRQTRHVSPDDKLVIYANNVSLTSSIWDVSLEFGMIVEASDKELIIRDLATVILSPAHAKLVAQLLTYHVGQYEAQFGVLPVPPSRPSEES